LSTKTLIDEIVPQVPDGYQRSTGSRSILKLIERGQDLYLDYDAPHMRYYAPENQGFPPYLTTTAGTYRYEIKAANLTDVSSLTVPVGGSSYAVRAKRVIKVFVETENIDYSMRWIGEQYQFSWFNPYTTATSRLLISDVPVHSYPATEQTPAHIQFTEDPGTTTQKYCVLFTWEAPRLTSENIPLVVPEIYELGLEDYVVGTVQYRANGKMGERLSRFIRDNGSGDPSWITRYRNEMQIGASRAPLKTIPRDC